MSSNSTRPAGLLLQQLSHLRFRKLFLIAATLFVLDLLLPDFVPFIDEILLGLLTLMFWAIRKPPATGTLERSD